MDGIHRYPPDKTADRSAEQAERTQAESAAEQAGEGILWLRTPLREPQAVAVLVLHVHLASAVILLDWFRVDGYAFGGVFGVQRIHVGTQDDASAPFRAVARNDDTCTITPSRTTPM